MKKYYSNLKMIVCVAENNLIGDFNPNGNGLLWDVKEELEYFKNITTGNILLFGSKTAKCIPINLIKKTRDIYILNSNIDIFNLIEHLSKNDKSIFVCGGYTIYKYFLENFIFSEIYFSKLKKNIKIKKFENPLYLPNLEDYGYKKILIKEYDDFYAYKYIGEINDN